MKKSIKVVDYLHTPEQLHILDIMKSCDELLFKESGSYHPVNFINTFKLDDLLFGCVWETGGQSGGSCWGGNPQQYHTSNREPDLKSLDLILKEKYPQISYLEYRELVSDLFVYDTDYRSEYYGNGTDYAVKYCKLSAFLEKLNAFLSRKE
ncbi:MAG: hypothetical protein WC511_03075 [Candidatus Pacearchaeota archaeon]